MQHTAAPTAIVEAAVSGRHSNGLLADSHWICWVFVVCGLSLP